ncbi:MAG TPA: DUF222 domain-containing protein [Bradyrhizobium sp.]|nr:DUF222 domain-containing protein [Bradyrhizobium sp.]
MIDNTNNAEVGGEPCELLRRAIARLTMTRGPNGEGVLAGKLPQELAEPFTRALMRIEAEQLLNDADLLKATIGETRTQSERRADAFTALVRRLYESPTA